MHARRHLPIRLNGRHRLYTAHLVQSAHCENVENAEGVGKEEEEEEEGDGRRGREADVLSLRGWV